MKNKIFISVEEKIQKPDWIQNAKNFVQKAMDLLEYKNEEISILFCSDEFIKNLNSNYRKIESATDVLSFENDFEYEDEEGKWFCKGDIAVSLESLKKNCDYFNEEFDFELKRLLIHGILHLNGMDHGDEHIEKNKIPECEMLVLQEKILEQLKNEKIIL